MSAINLQDCFAEGFEDAQASLDECLSDEGFAAQQNGEVLEMNETVIARVLRGFSGEGFGDSLINSGEAARVLGVNSEDFRFQLRLSAYQAGADSAIKEWERSQLAELAATEAEI